MSAVTKEDTQKALKEAYSRYEALENERPARMERFLRAQYDYARQQGSYKEALRRGARGDDLLTASRLLTQANLKKLTEEVAWERYEVERNASFKAYEELLHNA